MPPLPKQGHPEQAAQDHIQAAFGDPQGGFPTASLGSLCQGSVTRPAQECCLVLRGSFLGAQLCPLPPVLALGTTEQSLALSSASSLQGFRDMDEIPLGLLFSRLSSPRSPSLSSQEMLQCLCQLHGPALHSLQYAQVSRAGEAQN